jgi:precorrin-2 dehydrogenase/sirohydrochlorin ferrochelatase
MAAMRYYPLLLDVTNMHSLVVGAGEVGLRKIQGLLDCGPARIKAVDPAPPRAELVELLASRPNFTYQQRPFAPTDLDGMHLIFACTPRRDVNQAIGVECARRGLLCNLSDDPERGNFVLPASIARGDLTIIVSTNGASPALSRIIRQDLEQRFGPEYAPFTRLLRQIRVALLAQGWPSAANRIIFRDLATSALPELIKTNKPEQCQALLTSLLPDPLHSRIGDWCHDCFQTL